MAPMGKENENAGQQAPEPTEAKQVVVASLLKMMIGGWLAVVLGMVMCGYGVYGFCDASSKEAAREELTLKMFGRVQQDANAMDMVDRLISLVGPDPNDVLLRRCGFGGILLVMGVLILQQRRDVKAWYQKWLAEIQHAKE